MSGLKSGLRNGRDVHELWQIDIEDYVNDLAWSGDRRFLAAISVGGRVCVCAHETRELHVLGQHAGGGSSVSWRPGTTELASIGHDGTVKIWEATTQRLIRELDAGAEWGTRVAWRPQGTSLASAAGKCLRLFTTDGEIAYESHDHESTIADIGWNPDGSAIAVAAYFGVTLHIPGRPLRRLEWKGSSLALAWSPTAKYLVTGEQDSSVHVWYVKTGRDSQMSGFATKVLELSWHRSGNYLATGGSDSIVLWDTSGSGPEGRKPRMLQGHTTRLTQLQFQLRGDDIASADADGMLLLWTPLTHVTPYFGRTFESAVTRLAWSPDDRRLAIGERNGMVTTLGFSETR
jgi:WD40 repeat protein